MTTKFLQVGDQYADSMMGAVNDKRALLLHINTESESLPFGCEDVAIEHP